jgi:hypothetical protein
VRNPEVLRYVAVVFERHGLTLSREMIEFTVIQSFLDSLLDYFKVTGQQNPLPVK